MRKNAYIRSEPSNFIEIFLDGEAVGVFGSGEGDAILKKIEDHFGLCVSETVTSHGLRISLGQRETELKRMREERDRAAGNVKELLSGLKLIAKGWRANPEATPCPTNAECLRFFARSMELRGMGWTIEGLVSLADTMDKLEGTAKCPTCGKTKE